MERWQFLIQKEGDRLWTPINQSMGELEEGRYRMMAHSSQANFEVDIRITYQSPESDRPPSQIQNCCRRTNAQGLIMLLPFTYLEPGIWELRCYGDLMSELSGQGWQEQVRLQISSKIRQEKSLEEKAPQSPQDKSSYELNSQDKASYYLQKLEDLLRHKIEPMLNSFETLEPISLSTTNVIKGNRQQATGNREGVGRGYENEISSPQEDSQLIFQKIRVEKQSDTRELEENLNPIEQDNQADLPEPINHSALPEKLLKILLHQDEFNRNEGEPILISGTVDIEDSNCSSLPEFQGKLRYELQEPETQQRIINVEQLIEENIFPFIFRYALEIPSEWEMDFLKLEVILETIDGIELDRQSLSITTNLESYLSNPINYTITLSDSEEQTSFAFDLLIEEENLTSSLNLDLPQPTKMARVNRSFRPSEGQILPPKITRTLESSTPSKTPKLPQFRKPQLNQVEVKEDKNKSSQTTSLDYAFQSLEVQERFLERLSSLAGKTNQESGVRSQEIGVSKN